MTPSHYFMDLVVKIIFFISVILISYSFFTLMFFQAFCLDFGVVIHNLLGSFSPTLQANVESGSQPIKTLILNQFLEKISTFLNKENICFYKNDNFSKFSVKKIVEIFRLGYFHN